MVFGEITTNASVPYETIVREAIKTVGYDNIGTLYFYIIINLAKGLDYRNASVMISLD